MRRQGFVQGRRGATGQDPVKQAGAHAYSVDGSDWRPLLGALEGRDADVMVEAKGNEYALAPMGVEIR
jgi:UV DNA damage endonuclease